MAEWKSRARLEDHFHRHGAEVGARDVADYARLSDLTIRDGVRLAFRRTGTLRIGYYHLGTKRFVVTDEDGAILSLSRQSENHVRTLAGSTYAR